MARFSTRISAGGKERRILAHVLTETDSGSLIAWERPSRGRRVYLSSGIHGDEPAGPLALTSTASSGVTAKAVGCGRN